mmetsp:Transcript_25357/g.71698  ORF Transcript_25357/g.71698 Transcript_25357/m.71698 type:complete len:315 (-) Transcript_25357:112-1056(-)
MGREIHAAGGLALCGVWVLNTVKCVAPALASSDVCEGVGLVRSGRLVKSGAQNGTGRFLARAGRLVLAGAGHAVEGVPCFLGGAVDARAARLSELPHLLLGDGPGLAGLGRELLKGRLGALAQLLDLGLGALVRGVGAVADGVHHRRGRFPHLFQPGLDLLVGLADLGGGALDSLVLLDLGHAPLPELEGVLRAVLDPVERDRVLQRAAARGVRGVLVLLDEARAPVLVDEQGVGAGLGPGRVSARVGLATTGVVRADRLRPGGLGRGRGARGRRGRRRLAVEGHGLAGRLARGCRGAGRLLRENVVEDIVRVR